MMPASAICLTSHGLSKKKSGTDKAAARTARRMAEKCCVIPGKGYADDIIEEQASWAYRSNAEIDAYNRIAREVLVPRGVRINELGEFAKRECSDLHRDWTHFNDEGSGRLADEIIRFLEKEDLI